MKLGNFYHPNYRLHLYDYIPNVLVDVSFGLLQVFHVELKSQHSYCQKEKIEKRSSEKHRQ